MALEQKLSLKLAQKLVMTPSLQQAIKLLQMTRLEVEAVISQELVENPLLEEAEQDWESVGDASPDSDLPQFSNDTQSSPIETIDFDSFIAGLEGESWESGSEWSQEERLDGSPSTLENTLASSETLQSHLLWQLRMTETSPQTRLAAEFIIGNIDSAGFLNATMEELETSLGPELAEGETISVVRQALKIVQSFDPPGVGQMNMVDCLKFQLYKRGETESSTTLRILDHWELFIQKKFDVLARSLGISLEEVRAAATVISTLELRPGLKFDSEKTHIIEPDVSVIRVGNDYVVQLNDSGMPRLRISRTYRRMLSAGSHDGSTSGAVSYLREKMKAALWLIRSLDQRQRTIYKVANSIVSRQTSFFERGVEAIRPMVLRDVAEDIGMHESTVSRVVSNKYMHTPQGVFLMKFFFHSGIVMERGGGISSLSVKQRIKHLVGAEDIKTPLSDSDIVNILRNDGIQIARRTIAKYRDELGIPSSSDRRRAL